MTVLDASALIAYLLDEPARAEVGDLLRKRPPPSISAVNLEALGVRTGGARGCGPGDFRGGMAP